ncbi:hypothetical protein PEC18_13825 [Paucibacter sp. O1-1]|nr:hypothetical protein [Paucibacter sp. O1-1]MDA3826896.1 hypothetical protein [Paucibacter sp. O1-1]
MIHESSEAKLKAALDAFVLEKLRPEVSEDKTFRGHRLVDIALDEQDFQTVKIQLRALGLMAKSEKNRSVKDSGTYWTLTPYGDEVMTRLRAIKRSALLTKYAPDAVAPSAGSQETPPNS